MRGIKLIVGVALVVSFGLPGGPGACAAPADTVDALLPQVPGWKLAEAPETYTPDNLFDYIDGNAELYLSYGFKRLVSAMYVPESGNEDEAIVVDVYDQGTPLGAFGLYSSMCRPGLSYAEIGCEAIVSPLQVRFWQNRFEVEINGADESQAALLKEFARAVSAKLPACKEIPELKWLPEEGQMPHTLKYVADGFLGQSFLPGGFEAQYKVDGAVVTAFVTRCSAPDSAQTCLRRYVATLGKFEGAVARQEGQFWEVVHKYVGHVWVSAEGPWFFGARCETESAAARKMAEHLRERLRKIAEATE
ncbi:MAG: hypothetical protein GXO73_09305 [Calditrichaeota bacterium]|nr:hypothetical protein [Calditrichota bacterium]